MSADPVISVDGRRARRDQNRERVVDAMLELYREGELRPAVADVAERSGVSHRSVFRYFDDLDELCRIAIQRQWAVIGPLWELDGLGEGSLEDRVARIVEQRLAIYDVAAPVARVGHMRAPVEPVLLDHLRRNGREARAQVVAHFAPELDRLDPATAGAVADAATAALSIENVETLRYLRELDREAAAAAMTVAVLSLMGGR